MPRWGSLAFCLLPHSELTPRLCATQKGNRCSGADLCTSQQLSRPGIQEKDELSPVMMLGYRYLHSPQHPSGHTPSGRSPSQPSQGVLFSHEPPCSHRVCPAHSGNMRYLLLCRTGLLAAQHLPASCSRPRPFLGSHPSPACRSSFRGAL